MIHIHWASKSMKTIKYINISCSLAPRYIIYQLLMFMCSSVFWKYFLSHWPNEKMQVQQNMCQDLYKQNWALFFYFFRIFVTTWTIITSLISRFPWKMQIILSTVKSIPVFNLMHSPEVLKSYYWIEKFKRYFNETFLIFPHFPLFWILTAFSIFIWATMFCYQKLVLYWPNYATNVISFSSKSLRDL